MTSKEGSSINAQEVRLRRSAIAAIDAIATLDRVEAELYLAGSEYLAEWKAAVDTIRRLQPQIMYKGGITREN